LESGLPDGIFPNQKSHFGYILEDLAMEDVGAFMAIWSIMLPFGICYGYLVYFLPFWYVVPKKSGNPVWNRI
jgi:hypothetical protein